MGRNASDRDREPVRRALLPRSARGAHHAPVLVAAPAGAGRRLRPPRPGPEADDVHALAPRAHRPRPARWARASHRHRRADLQRAAALVRPRRLRSRLALLPAAHLPLPVDAAPRPRRPRSARPAPTLRADCTDVLDRRRQGATPRADPTVVTGSGDAAGDIKVVDWEARQILRFPRSTGELGGCVDLLDGWSARNWVCSPLLRRTRLRRQQEVMRQATALIAARERAPMTNEVRQSSLGDARAGLEQIDGELPHATREWCRAQLSLLAAA